MKKLVGLIVIILIAVGVWQRDLLLSSFSGSSNTPLRIVLSEGATDLSPFSLNRNNLTRTANIYESLVTFDRNLKIVPALAVSWGNLDENTWEFKLRRGISFHDGTDFTAEDVVNSFETAKTGEAGQVAPYVSSIAEVKVVDPTTIQITTSGPDPLILSKLTKVFIHKGDQIGTGPYKVREWLKGQILSLTKFEDYWGREPAYTNVNYVVTGSKFQRQKDFQEGITDILASVPPDQALVLPEENRKSNFALEVNFMLFNPSDPVLENTEIRDAISRAFDPVRIQEIGNDFVRPASQFVAPGVFGYNSDIPTFEYSEETAPKDLFGGRLERISLDYLPNYQTLVEYLGKQLRDAGFSVKFNPLSAEALLSKLKSGSSQLLLVGWQAENGDAGDFLDAFVHSQGEFNGGRFADSEIDALIESARTELTPSNRVKLLQDIMLKVDEANIGVPLFESSNLYAVQKDIKWEPRLDSLVLATEVR